MLQDGVVSPLSETFSMFFLQMARYCHEVFGLTKSTDFVVVLIIV